jgi:hypothetical protein
MTPESRNSSLLGNGSVNTFLQKQMCATVEERRFSVLRTLLRSGVVNISAAVNQHATIEEVVFSGVAAPRLYKEDLTQLELKFGRVLELAVAAEN